MKRVVTKLWIFPRGKPRRACPLPELDDEVGSDVDDPASGHQPESETESAPCSKSSLTLRSHYHGSQHGEDDESQDRECDCDGHDCLSEGEDVLGAVVGHLVSDAVVPLETQLQGHLTSGVAVVPRVAAVALDTDGLLLAVARGLDLRATGVVGGVLGSNRRVHVLIMTHGEGRDNDHLTC